MIAHTLIRTLTRNSSLPRLMAPLPLIIIALLAPSAAAQHHGDVFVAIESDQIITGLIDEDENVELNVRTFEVEFGEAGLPEFADEPGFEAFAGTFDPASRIGWNASHGLRRWNGTGFDESLEETITVNFSSLSFEIGTEPVEGFDLAVQPDGGLHRHLGFLLDHPTSDPAIGVYLVELVLYSTDNAVAPSEPFWIVLNYQASEEDHEAAAMWVEENLEGDKPCLGDIDRDHDVDTDDLLTLLSQWGSCDTCSADIDANGSVDVADLLALLAAWGECH